MFTQHAYIYIVISFINLGRRNEDRIIPSEIYEVIIIIPYWSCLNFKLLENM